LLTGGFVYDRLLVEYLRGRGEEVEVFPLPWRRYVPALLDNFSLTPARLLKNRRFDLVLEDGLAHPSLLRFNQEMRRGSAGPVISILHSLRANEACPSWMRAAFRKSEGAYLRKVDGAVFNSVTTRTDAERLAGRALRGVVACPGNDRIEAGISDEAVGERARSEGPLQILFAGSVTRHKGLHHLLAALDRLPSGEWRLTVAGNEWMEPRYVGRVRSKIEQSGWGNRVEFLGGLRGEALRECFLRSHVLAVPSAYEGFGMAYLEGMGFGLPAIASTRGAAREVIGDGENGFLVAPGDSRALAQRISCLAKDRELLARMGLKARRRQASHPTWAQTLSLVHSFLREFA
jgi:glycosyltransferase involved in cell wall biosynthesis